MQSTPSSVRTPSEAGPDAPDDVERHTIRPTITHDVLVDETEDGQTEITVPISSTTEHRSGGVMTEPALDSMVDQLEAGTVGLWDDHGLDETGWREYRRSDMYGWWVGGYVEDETLYATARLREGDSRADDLVDQLDQGMPIGFSIGYYVERDEWIEREEGEVREILAVDLLECSPVGIPDNKEAYANAGMTIAGALADAGIQLDQRAAETVATSITDELTTMSDNPDDPEEESNEASEYDEEEEENADGDNEDEEEESNETHATAEEAANAVIGIYEAHMEAAAEDVESWLEENADGYSEEDEEEAEGDKDGKEENSAELEELRSELAELRSEKEDLEAKVNRVESESRDSAGRQGMSPPSNNAETNDDDPEETNTSKPRNTTEEALLFAED